MVADPGQARLVETSALGVHLHVRSPCVRRDEHATLPRVRTDRAPAGHDRTRSADRLNPVLSILIPSDPVRGRLGPDVGGRDMAWRSLVPIRVRSRGEHFANLAFAVGLMTTTVLAGPAVGSAGGPRSVPSPAGDGVAIASHRPRGTQRTQSTDGRGTYVVRFADGVDPSSGVLALHDDGVT